VRVAPLASDTLVAGRYRLLHRLGTGGMADVWAADDQMLDRRVALKFLLPRYSEDQQFVERFRREAAAAAGLQHPNVVGVFDRGEHEGVPFIAMEYVQGASLKELIDRGLTVGEAVEIIRQVLAGARFAHSKGIIHRDLKPQNVLVDAEGRARVADFGIARAGASEITQTGSVLGTAQYLSPEQAQGLPVTAASDLYSVGVMLYEALTRRVPFDADTPVAVALKQVSEQAPPPSRLNPRVPPALDAVVLKALAKDPANRFASAEQFLAALDAAEADPTSRSAMGTAAYAAVSAAAAAGAATTTDGTAPPGAEAPPEAEPGGFWTRNRLILAGLIVAALLAGGALAYFLTRGGSTSRVPVPSVIGELQQQASRKLKHRGFHVSTALAPNPKPPGTVLEQEPSPGSVVDEGATVNLSVSSGPGLGTVPNVVGKPVADAIRLLREKGFKARVTHRFSDRAKGAVIEQDPSAGARESRGSSVDVTVSKGRNLVTVPSVVGQQQADAETTIREAGLRPKPVTMNADQPDGQVINVDPGAGSSVDRGSVVTITVSNGAGSLVVPNVIGELEGEAQSTLRANGARNINILSRTTTTASEDGRVIDQAPSAGTRLRSTDTITIFVGKFKQPTTTTTPTVTTPTTTTTTPTTP
jgi:eukaryotic-like serine/threonine-protein kinase